MHLLIHSCSKQNKCFNTYLTHLSNNIFKEKLTSRYSLNPYYILGIVSLFYTLNLMTLTSLNGIILPLSYRWGVWTQKVLIACPKPNSTVGRRHLDSSLSASQWIFLLHILLLHEKKMLKACSPSTQKRSLNHILLNASDSREFQEWKSTQCNKDSLLPEEYNQIPFKYSAPLAHISAHYFQIINCLT